ncbi:hypothetical protein LQ327_17855 [Actinomycetospora endophytica]|uniref:DUF4118 domain-containing protein n=1 Tax=Actinomycetospora endophytica TaxID=2291215 RepID=A0ABS8PCU4_9PSEU|nr:hypothetical protein [Actinomycetospora endophytica]MCD2195236.1 hypothetical protein [Actinomycetospora endophytica]
MDETSESIAEAPAGLLVPPAAAVGFVAAVAIGAVAPPDSWWALVALVAGCAVTSTVGSGRAALVIAVLWALCADGFVAHRYGRLVPVGPGDLAWLAAFAGAGLLGAWCRLPPALVRRRVDLLLRIGREAPSRAPAT